MAKRTQRDEGPISGAKEEDLPRVRRVGGHALTKNSKILLRLIHGDALVSGLLLGLGFFGA